MAERSRRTAAEIADGSGRRRLQRRKPAVTGHQRSPRESHDHEDDSSVPNHAVRPAAIVEDQIENHEPGKQPVQQANRDIPNKNAPVANGPLIAGAWHDLLLDL